MTAEDDRLHPAIMATDADQSAIAATIATETTRGIMVQ